MSKLMPCSFCKNLYEAIELEQVIQEFVVCANCKDNKARRKEELEIMRSRGDL